jgi:hypothetical protein
MCTGHDTEMALARFQILALLFSDKDGCIKTRAYPRAFCSILTHFLG